VRLRILHRVFCACALAAGVSQAQSKEPLAPYPSRPLRMIVASSPGTASDFFARVLSQELAAVYRQNVVVDNRSGAGGLIGNALVSKATPDGHTVAMVGVTRIISELVRDDPPYRALADAVGVAHVASITNVLTVTTTLPVRSVGELIRYGRARSGELNFASIGIGSSSHFAAEIFTRAAGMEAVHVPFRILSDVFVETLLGRVHYGVLTMPAVLTLVRDGRLRALAVMTPQRSTALPDIPTIGEAGLPEAQFDNWSGIVAPHGTPRRIVEQLNGDIVRLLRKPEMRVLFARQGAESIPDSTPDGFMRLMQADYLRYQKVIREAGIRQ
jgi:tripartite-type tricarboxylate transporter receptor subunit TctC